MEYGILTTRFTNETYEENRRWREANNYVGCIYMSKTKISDSLPYDKPYFVIEMNNSINKIMGIGVINIKHCVNRENIYSNLYYNRYMYKGPKHIALHDGDKYVLDEELIELFETPLFYGKGHMKRGQSMTHFPYKKMSEDHVKCLKRILKLK